LTRPVLTGSSATVHREREVPVQSREPPITADAETMKKSAVPTADGSDASTMYGHTAKSQRNLCGSAGELREHIVRVRTRKSGL